MIVTVADRSATNEQLAGGVLCHDLRGPGNEIIFRKGHALRTEDLAALAEAPWTEIHLLELGPDDVGQRAAGQRLAASLSGQGLQTAPSGHRHVLTAGHRGLVKIDVATLLRINSIPGVAVYTLRDEAIAAQDQIVAEAQITQLAIDRGSLERAEQMAREGGAVIRLLPFIGRDVVIWMRDDRRVSALTEKLRFFGCPVREVIDLPRHSGKIRQSLERHAVSGATLFLISGSNALDPLDPVFAALQALGASIQRIGLPVHPGTLLWIASWGEITIIGLPTCGLGTQLTAFDLILPKLLAEGRVGDEDLASFGHGGILNQRERVR
jgi:hypothetical protein